MNLAQSNEDIGLSHYRLFMIAVTSFLDAPESLVNLLRVFETKARAESNVLSQLADASNDPLLRLLAGEADDVVRKCLNSETRRKWAERKQARQNSVVITYK